ncbi:MAG: glycosyltransferase family 39 protein [Candidatus Brocadiia bacterium]
MAPRADAGTGGRGGGALRRRLGLAALLAFAAALRIYPLGLANPRFYHVDEWNFALSARRMVAEGDLDPRRYIHPALYRYATAAVLAPLAGAWRTLGLSTPAYWQPFVAGRLVSAAAGVLGVWAVMALARRLVGWGPALFAGLVLAAMPLHVQFSHVAKPDVLMASWVAVATLLAWRLAEEPRRRLYVLAGLCAGFAVATKYNGVVACVPILVGHLAARGPRRGVRRLLAPDLWLAAGCAVAGFALASPYTLLQARQAVDSVATGYRNLVVAGRAEPERAAQPPALVDFARHGVVWLGAPTLALAAAGAVLAWRRARRGLLVVGSVVAATLALISTWAVRQHFYLMPLAPATAVLAALPVAWVRRRLAVALAALGLAPMVAVSAREIVRLRRPDTRQLAFRWLCHNLEGARARVLRDYDALPATAARHLPLKNPGFGFYRKVDRAYLKAHGITHFVLSDAVASTRELAPDAAERKRQAHAALVACGRRLDRFEPGWWRAGPGVTVYAVKPELLRQFAAERERETGRLRERLAELEARLEGEPADAQLHLEAGRLRYRLALLVARRDPTEQWRRALAHFRHAAEARPRLAAAHYDRGCVHLRLATWLRFQRGDERGAMGHFRSAEEAFRRAIAIQPGEADFHFNLAFTLWAAGRPGEGHEADAALRAARRLDPAIGDIEQGIRPLH